MRQRRGGVYPLSDVAKGVNEPFGFDEFDSFSVVHRAAAEVAEMGKTVHLAIKQRFVERLETMPRHDGLTVLPLPRTEQPHPWVLWADLLAGIGSMLLLEAVALGRPVISVQPGLEREDIFVASQRGCARTLTDADYATTELRNLMASAQTRSGELELNRRFLDLLPPDSTSNILDWLRAIPAR